MSDRNVFQRLVEVCKDIGSQPWYKDQSNSQFKSIPIDKMRGGVREACAKNGIVHVGPLNIAYHREPKGDKMMLYYGSCVFRYVNADKPDDYVEYESVGEAMDTGDKCMGKLVTNMIKNHYKAAFDIGEQGKDDVDSYTNEDIYAEAERINNKSESKKPAVPDPFFKKKDAKDDFVTADKVAAASAPKTKDELIAHLNVMTSHPKTKDTILKYKQSKNAKTIYDLSDEDKRELYDIVSAMTEGS